MIRWFMRVGNAQAANDAAHTFCTVAKGAMFLAIGAAAVVIAVVAATPAPPL